MAVELARIVVVGDSRIRTAEQVYGALAGVVPTMPAPDVHYLIDKLASSDELGLTAVAPQLPGMVSAELFSDDVVSALARVLDACDGLGLRLFDLDEGRFLRSGAKVRGSRPTRRLNRIASIGELEDAIRANQLDEVTIAATGGRTADSLLPQPVVVAKPVARVLRSLLPDEVPPVRQSVAQRRRHVADLSSPDARQRRVAAFELGGWSSDTNLDAELLRVALNDGDDYPRAASALTLSLHRSVSADTLGDVAEGLVQRLPEHATTVGATPAAMGILAFYLSVPQPDRSPTSRLGRLVAEFRSKAPATIWGPALQATISHLD